MRAAAGIIDEVKLGILDHDVALCGAIHTGPNASSPQNRTHKCPGSRALFDEEIDLGYRCTPRSNVSFFFDRISGANLTPHNPGLAKVGSRFG